MGDSDATPIRQYMDDPDIEWKAGKPDYTAVNAKYLQEKLNKHEAGSIEKVVENLVKTWEMESSHKGNPKDWQSVVKSKFNISANGGFVGTLKDNIEIGNYNILMKESPLYDSSITWEQSHDMFREAFPDGFPWELIELHSGPPTVSFTWRHWAHWKGAFLGIPPTGELLEMYGNCIAKVNPENKIEKLEIYFDPNQVLAKMLKFNVRDIPNCPYAKLNK